MSTMGLVRLLRRVALLVDILVVLQLSLGLALRLWLVALLAIPELTLILP